MYVGIYELHMTFLLTSFAIFSGMGVSVDNSVKCNSSGKMCSHAQMLIMFSAIYSGIEVCKALCMIKMVKISEK